MNTIRRPHVLRDGSSREVQNARAYRRLDKRLAKAGHDGSGAKGWRKRVAEGLAPASSFVKLVRQVPVEASAKHPERSMESGPVVDSDQVYSGSSTR